MESYSYQPPLEIAGPNILARGPTPDRPRWIAIDKPVGLLSVPGRSPGLDDCARERVRSAFSHATGSMTVHRLDLDTSGILLLALDPDTHRALSIQFERRQVRKEYSAVLEREIDADEGLIELPIAKDWPNRPKQKICFESGRWSTTRFRVLSRADGRSRVLFEPITGRSHQLRIHAADELGLGTPIVGDRLYGDASLADRLLLHASMLEFEDPATGDAVRVESPPPF